MEKLLPRVRAIGILTGRVANPAGRFQVPKSTKNCIFRVKYGADTPYLFAGITAVAAQFAQGSAG
jgi:hypothetical protein